VGVPSAGGHELQESVMSFGEKVYLAGVLFAFGSFMVMMATLCWLDARDERIKRRREAASQTPAAKHEAFVTGAAVHHKAA
jgi:hypothetical protein